MTTTPTIKERPILFSGAMVRAILEGRKTQTRRVMKPQPAQVWGWGVSFQDPEYFTAHVRYPGGSPPDPWVRSPYGRPPYRGNPGDQLWVRETWHLWGPPERQVVDYAATCPDADQLRWKPSIHMPRKYSRLTLEVTGARVERVQDISETDMHAEGLEIAPNGEPWAGFMVLWDSINGPRGYGWDVNPWVWVVEFRRVQP